MNTIKRIFTILLTGILATTMLLGCGPTKDGKKEQGQSANDIEIAYWRAGLGVDWLEAVIEAFNEKYPEYNVYYTATASAAGVTASFGLEDIDTVDLYLVMKEYSTEFLEPLNDVLDTTIEGESKSIKEKFNASYLAMEELDGKYYNLTYGGGIMGFVYNTELFEQAGIDEIPRTTDEFAKACSVLSDKGITPLCHFNPVGYYLWLEETFFAQYDGMDYYRDFYQNPSKEKLLKEDGRYETLKAMEKFITPDYVMKGSNSGAHTTIQTKFLEGSAAIMFNGSWLSNEMSQSGDKIEKFKMMKTPVISAITNKLSTVKNDSQLRKLITAIDNVTDGTESIETYKDGENYVVEGINVSAADWEYVKNARNMIPANYADSSALIPTYSNAKEGAKEFLRFLYSDEGYRIYLDTLHIAMPLELSEGEINTDSWNAFEQNQAQIFQQSNIQVANCMMSNHALFLVGGAMDAYLNNLFVPLYCASNQADRINAEKVWSDNVLTVEQKYDKVWMMNIK